VHRDGLSSARRFLASNAARHLISGAVAGVVSNTLVAPLDILRLNLMVATEQTNAVQVARALYTSGGLPAFWKGNAADVARTIPSSAIRFYSFAVYKARLNTSCPAVQSLLAGGFAGMTAMAALFPLETIRTRMAIEAAAGALRGESMVRYVRRLVAADGFSSLYRGLPPSLISVMPYFGVRFGMYDILKRWHLRRSPWATEGEVVPVGASAIYGFAAGFTASGLTFPFEVVRRRAMIGAGASNPFVAVPAILAKEGLAGLYKGYGVNIVKVAPASAITFLVYEETRKRLDRFAKAEAEEKRRRRAREEKEEAQAALGDAAEAAIEAPRAT
jgi:solute carrier family 25 phosphate transporter 23/24/25/41/solute carrier family 25 protein 42